MIGKGTTFGRAVSCARRMRLPAAGISLFALLSATPMLAKALHCQSQSSQATADTANQQSATPPATDTKPATTSPHKAFTAKKSTPTIRHTTAHRKRPISPRVRRMRQAFVASASLRPMAQQLLADRTLAGYAGVQAYARAHSKEDAGALAWLVLGYAHVLDRDFGKAIDPLNRAKVHAGDLRDYVDYYLGTSYMQTGRLAEALATLTDFAKGHPDSLLVRDADLSYADALMLEGQSSEAVSVLESVREPIRSDIEFALGRAYAASGQSEKAARVFENIYYTMPTAVEADSTYSELKKLPGIPPPTAAQIKTRADELMAHHRYSEAAEEYRILAGDSSLADRPAIELSLADALLKSGRHRDAKQVLASLVGETGEINARRLYLLGQVAWSSNDNDAFFRSVNDLRQTAPASPWLEQALLSAANLHLVHHEYDQALDAYREAEERFRNGPRASYVHWKTAWLTLRQGRDEAAGKLFEEQISLYPTGAETPAALYWRARLAEEENQPLMARAFYEKLSDRYHNFYYAELARERLTHLPAAQDTTEHYAILDRVPPLDSAVKISEVDPPTDELHVQKAQLLGNGGLVDFAVHELQFAAANAGDGASWGPAETARLYDETGHYDQGIEVLKHSTPNYFALDITDLPRAYWEALFPRPYWSDLKRAAAANGLDPYLVASLIRQESEFNPNAVSRANAVGLMQLLPKTGKVVAHEVKLRRYSASQLYTPSVNLQLGTRYFRGMVDRFGGSFEYALAAYNAGSDRVEEWLGQGKYRDPQEFVESIPFTETREYVQAILRNASVYRQLYGTP